MSFAKPEIEGKGKGLGISFVGQSLTDEWWGILQLFRLHVSDKDSGRGGFPPLFWLCATAWSLVFRPFGLEQVVQIVAFSPFTVCLAWDKVHN